MTRMLLTYVLPLVLPTAAYLVWVWWARRRKKAQGIESGEREAGLKEGPWFWLILAGFVLMVAGLAYWGLTGGSEPGGVYYSPRYEDGKVIPGGVR